MHEIVPLEGTIQEYAWGSQTTLPRLLGRPVSGQPQAELWLGDHAKSPSVAITDAGPVPLDRVIAAHPAAVLGRAAAFGALPYLLKVLAIEAPLSLQLHPTAAQAVAGFEREHAAGLALDAPNRTYRDRNHKPELLVATAATQVMSGIRPREQLAAAVRQLDWDSAPLPLARLGNADDGSAVADTLRWLLQLPPDAAATLHRELRGRADPATSDGALLNHLAAAYPDDATILAALLLNSTELQPGEGIYTGAGTLHAYVRGSGVELMANSDNVLRAGLTPKHVDVGELLAVADFRSAPLLPLRGVADGCERRYPTPAREFLLSVIDLEQATTTAADFDTEAGPEVLLLLGASATLQWQTAGGSTRRLQLERGAAAFVPAAVAGYRAHGSGALYRARLPS
jgi:mannose-6-phosphate isomerase